MRKKLLLAVLTALTLATLACGINFNLPINTDIKTGPTTIQEIRVPQPDTTEDISEITLIFGAGELSLAPGAENNLLEGTATFNVPDLRPNISTRDNRVEISNGSLEINGIPNFQERVKNEWDFQLSDDPLDLSIQAGAYVGSYEFGGLNLQNLHVTDGAAEAHLNFAEPNQSVMTTLRYETGASNLTLSNLANANFETMIFQGGAGSYDLDFSGELQQNCTVFIEAGLSAIKISVPEGTRVTLRTEGGLSNTSIRGNAWEGLGNEYSMPGEGPLLNITVEMGAGNLVLQNP
ncbi:MAG: hypothetical protein H8E28_11425 [Anaerolineae bacterium]|nr:hypothetical protein [Anaerolineae bacterium]